GSSDFITSDKRSGHEFDKESLQIFIIQLPIKDTRVQIISVNNIIKQYQQIISTDSNYSRLFF
ncbi:MAG: hypothetical protein MJ131_11730, partial [Lachnospiraceae bacterium]|nr:hypothetical protein [Lachnospiraceae bacterium]